MSLAHILPRSHLPQLDLRAGVNAHHVQLAPSVPLVQVLTRQHRPKSKNVRVDSSVLTLQELLRNMLVLLAPIRQIPILLSQYQTALNAVQGPTAKRAQTLKLHAQPMLTVQLAPLFSQTAQ